jgi:hypothetical protein
MGVSGLPAIYLSGPSWPQLLEQSRRETRKRNNPSNHLAVACKYLFMYRSVPLCTLQFSAGGGGGEQRGMRKLYRNRGVRGGGAVR